jgi:hypothetical protein
MTNEIKYSGLCQTCDNAPTCTLQRMPHLEVIQCEEFSTHSAVRKPTFASEEAPFVDPADVARMGLCANCLNAVTCGLSKALDGVQQCEEYVLDEAGVIPPVQANRSESAA